eukprot:6459926-Amphidinium_carterae.1
MIEICYGVAKDSLRGQIYCDWKSLGLKDVPNVGDNGVHASASPFEGVCERLNWLGMRCSSDKYCSYLLQKGMAQKTIEEWSVDPQVQLESGKKGSIFDALEDLNATDCAEKLVVFECKLVPARKSGIARVV